MVEQLYATFMYSISQKVELVASTRSSPYPGILAGRNTVRPQSMVASSYR